MKRLRRATLVALFVLSASPHAHGEEAPPRFPIDEANPESSVPAREERLKAPLDFGYFLLEVTDRGTKALEAGDFQTSTKYFKAVVAAAPERSIGHAKLCESYIGSGEKALAIETCRQALGFPGVRVQDYLQFMKLLLAQGRALSPDEISELNAVFDHLRDKNITNTEVSKLECGLALSSNDESRLSRCSEALMKSGDKSPETFAYAWAHAKQTNNKAELSEVVLAAEKAGLPPQAIAAMTGKKHLFGRFSLAPGVLWGAAAFFGLGALALLGFGIHRPKSRPNTTAEWLTTPPA